MSYTLKELESVSRETLIANHDTEASRTGTSVNYFLGEIRRRDAAEQTAAIVRSSEAMERWTKLVAVLTVVIAVLTAASLIAVLSAGS